MSASPPTDVATAVPRPGAAGATLARALYSALLRLLLPVILLRYWWRGVREPGYRQAWGQRLGFGATQPPGAIWVHAVSLGETRAAAALVDALRLRLPGMALLLTHGTATGRTAGQALLQAGDRQAWLPLDTPGAVRRFFARQRPRLGVLMETEIWPNLLHEAHRQSVPMLLANARLSARSARIGERLAVLLRPAAATLADALAQTDADALRLRASGAPQVAVCGNLKFDMQPAPAQLTLGRRWRDAIGRPVVLAAITREGEEAALLAAWARAKAGAGGADALLIVVPRHPQRFDEVAALLGGCGLRIARRSGWGEMPSAGDLAVDAWLGDSMGEMPLYYAASDVALLGGSFAPLGGHNLIEAAACGCPLVIGPSTFNFAQAAEQAIDAGAAWRAKDIEQGLQHALALATGEAGTLAGARASALAFAAAHRGAADRMAERIVARLSGPAAR